MMIFGTGVESCIGQHVGRLDIAVDGNKRRHLGDPLALAAILQALVEGRVDRLDLMDSGKH